MRNLNLCALFLLLGMNCLNAQITVVKDSKPVSRILVEKGEAVDNQAALLLQDFVKRISGASLPVVNDKSPRKGDIVIGGNDVSGLTEDGFRLKTENGIVFISSGGDKGNIYGVVTLLEDYLGVAYYGANAYTLTERSTVVIPELDRAENPAFRYRQSQCYALREDPVYNYGSASKSLRKYLPVACGYIHSTVSCPPIYMESLIRNIIPLSMVNAVPEKPANGV